jgi:fatty acid-binding protein DegV
MNIIKDVVIAQIGPIIGSHTGPDMLALVYMGKK